MRPGPLQSILPSRAHASFPFVFRHQGKLFLVPETSTDCTVEIHVCEEFPTRWRLERVVLQGIDAADSIIFLKDGRWWLISAIRSREGRHLEIFFADDPLHGRWQAHPVNQTRLYQRVPFTSGRNAGPVIEHQGLLLRAAQRSRRYYGEGMQLMRIEMLTPTDYRERLYDGPHPLRGMIADWSPHHLSLADGFAAFDIRDRARDLQGLRSMPIVRRPRPEGDIPIPLAAS
ncbi:MAG: hypothetical protein JO256_14820 [Alphaproteobacteria bacterium]|nr:hypothetical protein [Alphaproteobacteria bacterium]